jgi:rubrerythrin
MELKGTKTLENLKKAFAGESQTSRRYAYFAHMADLEGYPEIAGLFRDSAEAETSHALGHLDLLKPEGDPLTGLPFGETAANLRAAIEGETFEHTQMYPAMARAAREEGLTAIADWFERLARAERSHAARFRKGLEGLDRLE